MRLWSDITVKLTGNYFIYYSKGYKTYQKAWEKRKNKFQKFGIIYIKNCIDTILIKNHAVKDIKRHKKNRNSKSEKTFQR